MDIAMASNPAARPRMLTCYLCGREFGTKSLPIHMPQCQEKWLNEENKKPKKERRPLPQPPKEMPIIGGPISPKEIDAFNEAMYEHWEKEVLESCQHCGRRFKPEALKIHNRSCTAEKPAKPAGTALTSASLSNNITPGAIAGTKHVARGAPVASPEESVSPKIAGGAKGGRVGTEGLRASMPLPDGATKKGNGALRASCDSVSSQKKSPEKINGRENESLSDGASFDMSSVGDVLLHGQGGHLKGLAAEGAAVSTEQKMGNGGPAKFCDECGAAFPKVTSRFCSECWCKRPGMSW